MDNRLGDLIPMKSKGRRGYSLSPCGYDLSTRASCRPAVVVVEPAEDGNRDDFLSGYRD